MSRPLERALDTYLAAAAKAGDRAATTRLIARWSPRLAAFAWRQLGHRDEVDDVLQDVWLELLKALPRLKAPEAFPAFAFRITARRCARAIGRMRSDRVLAAAVGAEPDAAPATDAETHTDMAKMREAMTRLPPDQHSALWLHHIQGLSTGEIALVLDVPVGTVKTRLMHARRKLAAELKGGDHE